MKTLCLRLSILAAIHWCSLFVALGAPFTFSSTGSLATGRDNDTTTLLQNGKVLVAGGYNGNPLASAQHYDPATGIWASTGSLATARQNHTATLLPNGKVLVTGGRGTGSVSLTSAELYDPIGGTWTATGSLTNARFNHTATLLSNGKVLVAGGFNSTSGEMVSAELYDPASGTWKATGNLVTARSLHTATLLYNQQVLVAGGQGASNNPLNVAELYDPIGGTWTATSTLVTARYSQTATLLPSGKVLVAGGQQNGAVRTAEIYDPAGRTWTATGILVTARYFHTAALLPNGKVLVAGGFNSTSGEMVSAELYDPAAGTWAATGTLAAARSNQTATLLPSGNVLVAAGFNGANTGAAKYLTSAELYDSASGSWDTTTLQPLIVASEKHTATLLSSGKVLVAGGRSFGNYPASTELFDPANGTWTATGDLYSSFGRASHTATLLPSGKVLIAGGDKGGALTSAQLYDPASGTWKPTSDLGKARYFHTATLLTNGTVLVAGGLGSGSAGYLTSAELYDPASGAWTATGSLNVARGNHTATLLPNGTVLVAGGQDGTNQDVVPRSAELYDPASGTWTIATRGFNSDYVSHTATLLPNGKVLVAGGLYQGTISPAAELYDPASGTLMGTGNLNTARGSHTATLLPNGKVLVAGGIGSGFNVYLTSAELYDPASGSWTPTGNLHTTRYSHTATLLPNGKVLAGGGNDGSNDTKSTELYDVGLGFLSAWQPRIGSAPSALPSGSPLTLTGFFQGVSQASGGNTQDSSSNYPIVQLRSLESSQVAFLPTAGWQGSVFTSIPVSGFSVGPALVTVFINGIPSDAKYLLVAQTTPAFGTQASGTTPVGGSISDSAVLDNGATLTGTITFKLFGPNDATCGAAAVFTSTKSVSGNGSYTSDSFTPTAAGTYRWVATYSGDANNNPVTGACNDANESVVVTPAPTPTPTPTPTATPTPTPTPTPGQPTVLANISTRLLVGTGDNVLIGGFIVSGTQTKKVLIRAIGPSLPLGGVLADPTLELYQGTTLLESNDNWMDSANKQAIIDSGAAPLNNLESAIVRSVAPGNYTAIERGVNNGTGIGVVEAYDLDTSANSKLANISTRGLVQTGDNVLFAGTIVVGQASQKVIIRALGPSTGVPGAMADPTLELHDGSGTLLETNDNWVDSPNKQAIIDSTIPPPNNLESAIVRILTPGNYTAIVRGVNNSTGIAVVEVYALN
jgi:hypothetical protein